jgi:hypothetical protein
MAMNDPNDDMARRNMDARPRIEERSRMAASPVGSCRLSSAP